MIEIKLQEDAEVYKLTTWEQIIVTELVPLRDIGKYVSFTGLIWAIADVAGPLLGGAFSQ